MYSVKHFFGLPCGLPIWDSAPVRPACLVDYLARRLAAAVPTIRTAYVLPFWRLYTILEGRRAAADLVNLRGRWTVRPFSAVRVGRCSLVVAIS